MRVEGTREYLFHVVEVWPCPFSVTGNGHAWSTTNTRAETAAIVSLYIIYYYLNTCKACTRCTTYSLTKPLRLISGKDVGMVQCTAQCLWHIKPKLLVCCRRIRHTIQDICSGPVINEHFWSVARSSQKTHTNWTRPGQGYWTRPVKLDKGANNATQ